MPKHSLFSFLLLLLVFRHGTRIEPSRYRIADEGADYGLCILDASVEHSIHQLADVDQNGAIDTTDALNILKAVVKLVTLPVEFNASRRALKQMEAMQLVMPEDMQGSRRVLRAAAMTYVAATLTAIMQLVRLLVIANRKK